MRPLLITLLICAACQSASSSQPSSFDDKSNIGDVAAQLQAAGSSSQASVGGRCSRNNGGCEQICRNQGRSSVCECEAGAYLKADGRSCWSWHGVQRVETFDGGDE